MSRRNAPQLDGQPDHHVLGQVLAQQASAARRDHPGPGVAPRRTGRGWPGGTAGGRRPIPPSAARARRGPPAARGRGRRRGRAAPPPRRGSAGRPCPTSSRSPETRRRDRFRPGATRDASTSVSQAGAQSTRRPNAASAAVSSSAWKSSITRRTGADPRCVARAAGRVLDRRPAAGQRRDRGQQRRLEVADERGLVGVPGLRPVPGDGRAAGRGEPRDERGLARARGCHHQRQPLAEGLAEASLETFPWQRVGDRDADLRGHHQRHPRPYPGRIGPRRSPPGALSSVAQ